MSHSSGGTGTARAAARTIETAFGVLTIVVTLAVLFAVVRGVDDRPPVVVDEPGCLRRTLTPAQLATEHWWDDC